MKLWVYWLYHIVHPCRDYLPLLLPSLPLSGRTPSRAAMLGLVVSLLGPNESFLLLLFLYLCFACRSKAQLPPGPTGYPLIGITIRELTTRPFETLSRWRTEFGA